jgi:hypothetical protein
MHRFEEVAVDLRDVNENVTLVFDDVNFLQHSAGTVVRSVSSVV